MWPVPVTDVCGGLVLVSTLVSLSMGLCGSDVIKTLDLMSPKCLEVLEEAEIKIPSVSLGFLFACEIRENKK